MPSRTTLVLLAPLLCWSGQARAFMGQCVLEVDGRTWLKGRCPITLDKGGDFTIGSDGTRTAKYFAMVGIDKEAGNANGFWNGPDGESHAHEPLGTLTRQGACWVNARAKVCATR